MIKLLILLWFSSLILKNVNIFRENNNYYYKNDIINFLDFNDNIIEDKSIENPIEKKYTLNENFEYKKLILWNDIVIRYSNIDISKIRDIIYYIFENKLCYVENINLNYNQSCLIYEKIAIIDFKLFLENDFLIIIIITRDTIKIYKYSLTEYYISLENTIINNFKNYIFFQIINKIFLIDYNEDNTIIYQYKLFFLIKMLEMKASSPIVFTQSYKNCYFLILMFKQNKNAFVYEYFKNKFIYNLVETRFEDIYNNEIIKKYYNNNFKNRFLLYDKSFNKYYKCFTEIYDREGDIYLTYYNKLIDIDFKKNSLNIKFLDYLNDKFIILNKNSKDEYEIIILSKNYKNINNIGKQFEFIGFDYLNQNFIFKKFDEVSQKISIVKLLLNYIQGTKVNIKNIKDLTYKPCFYKELESCKKQELNSNLNLFIKNDNISNYFLEIYNSYNLNFELKNLYTYFFIGNYISGNLDDIWIQNSSNFKDDSLSYVFSKNFVFIILKYIIYNFYLPDDIKELYLFKNDNRLDFYIINNSNKNSFIFSFNINFMTDYNKILDINLDKKPVDFVLDDHILKNLINCGNEKFYIFFSKNKEYKIVYEDNIYFTIKNYFISDYLCFDNKIYFLFNNDDKENNKKIIVIFYFIYINNYQIFKINFNNTKPIKSFILNNYIVDYYKDNINVYLVTFGGNLLLNIEKKQIDLKEYQIVYVNKKLNRILVMNYDKFKNIKLVQEYDLDYTYAYILNYYIIQFKKRYDFFQKYKFKLIQFNKINLFKFIVVRDEDYNTYLIDYDSTNILTIIRGSILWYKFDNILKTFHFNFMHYNKKVYVYIVKYKLKYSVNIFFKSFLCFSLLNIYNLNNIYDNNNYFDKYLVLQNKLNNSMKLINIKIKKNNNFFKIEINKKYIFTGFILGFIYDKNQLKVDYPIIFFNNSWKNLDYKYIIISKAFHMNQIFIICSYNSKYYLYINFLDKPKSYYIELINNNFKPILTLFYEDYLLILCQISKTYYSKLYKIEELFSKKSIILENTKKSFKASKIIFYKYRFIYFLNENGVEYIFRIFKEKDTLDYYLEYDYGEIKNIIKIGDDYYFTSNKKDFKKIFKIINNKETIINKVYENNFDYDIVFIFFINKISYFIAKNNYYLVLYSFNGSSSLFINKIKFNLCNNFLDAKKINNNIIITCLSVLKDIFIFNFIFDEKLILLMFYISESKLEELIFDMKFYGNYLFITSNWFDFKKFIINEKLEYKIRWENCIREIKLSARNNIYNKDKIIPNNKIKFKLLVRNFIKKFHNIWYFCWFFIIIYLSSVIYFFIVIFK